MGTTVDTKTLHDLNILECHNSQGIRYFGSRRFFYYIWLLHALLPMRL